MCQISAIIGQAADTAGNLTIVRNERIKLAHFCNFVKKLDNKKLPAFDGELFVLFSHFFELACNHGNIPACLQKAGKEAR
jgi:hypothetical protein